MEKDEKIFSLYDQLGNSGEKREAQKFIAKKCGVRVSSVRTNYLSNQEFPKNLDEKIKDDIIKFLEEKIELEKAAKVA